MKTPEQFFAAYAVASMDKDATAVAAFYADHIIAASKDQSSAFTNDHTFVAWLEGVFRFNEQSGLQQMTVKHVAAIPIGNYFYHATVTWSAVFAAKPQKQIEFDIHYILNQTTEGYKIILYISEENQEALMKEKGVLK